MSFCSQSCVHRGPSQLAHVPLFVLFQTHSFLTLQTPITLVLHQLLEVFQVLCSANVSLSSRSEHNCLLRDTSCHLLGLLIQNKTLGPGVVVQACHPQLIGRRRQNDPGSGKPEKRTTSKKTGAGLKANSTRLHSQGPGF
jgi:hypothetical protein